MIDAHHHVWDPADEGQSWLDDPALGGIRRVYTAADLRAVAPAEITATVLVQTLNTTAETERLLAVPAPVVAVVGWADLTAAGIGDELDRLRSRLGRLAGIRHLAQDEPDAGWLARPDVGRGLAAVASRGLVYDLLVRGPQREAALVAARNSPDVAFVLDHAGKPAIRDGEWEPWASWIAELAMLPNVTCKLSGLLTEAAPGADAAALRPYAEQVLLSFGPDRVMFGSDWPVCELAGGYPAVWETTRVFLEQLTGAERAAVLGTTAERVYAL
ncbi:amidohydrolase family protein [Pseudonocardia sp. GCM10023141]|uniref:amidohydrolase family protein n=1 Tax=Pseudonocardia sp. GCM10023141 TaxID=3252653 RepID=UPI00360C2356